MTGKIRAGQKLPGTWPSAQVWNGMVDAADRVRQSGLSEASEGAGGIIPGDRIKLRNDSGADRSRGDVLTVGDLLVDEIDPLYMWFEGLATALGTPFAILTQPLPSTEIGPARLLGVVKARVDVSNINHKRARVLAGQYTLKSDPTGPVIILHQPGSTGVQDCAVLLGGPRHGGGAAKLTSDMTGRSGTTAGEATADLIHLVGTTLTAITGATGLTIYNTTPQRAASGEYIQYKVNDDGDRLWDVADCP